MTTIEPQDYLQVRQTTDQPSSKFILSPRNSHLRRWNCLVAVTIIITCILETFMAAFDSTVAYLWGIAYFCDLIFCVDIVLTFCVAHRNQKGILNYDRKEISWAYIRTNFFVDLLSVLPTDILAVGIQWKSISKLLTLLRINRLIRFYRVLLFFGKREEELGTNTGLLRCLKYGVVSLITTHWVTCGWYALGCGGEHSNQKLKECFADSWADNPEFDVGFDLANATAIDSYVVSLYWAVATATSTGYGDIYSVNVKEKWFSILSMLVGIAVFFGMLLGGMTSMLTNFDQKRAMYVHRINNIKEHLREHNIPDDLTEQAMGYYKYLWIRKKGVLDSGMFKHLPLTMQADVTYTTCESILEKAQIFKGLEPGFLRMLSLKLRAEMYLPGQVVVKRGDIGSQMFYIHKGEVEILSPNSDEIVMNLGSGKLFGAVSLVYNIPRSASVRAKTHCDLMVLDRHDLAVLLSHYPGVSMRLQKQTGEHCMAATDRADEERRHVYKSYAEKNRRLSINSPWKKVQTLGSRKLSRVSTGSTADNVEETKVEAKHNLFSLTMDLKKMHKRRRGGIGDEETEADNEVQQNVPRCRRFYNWCHGKALVCYKWLSSALIHPRSRFAKVWQGVIVLTALLISIIHPYMACFGAHEYREGYFESGFGVSILTFTYILDVILLLDIVIHMRTEIHSPHGTISEFRNILHAYAASWLLFFDIVAVAPTEVFCLFYASGAERNRVAVLLRLNRIVKVLKMTSLFHQVEQTLKVSIIHVRTVKVILYIGVLSHWTACILYAAACYGAECRGDSWLVEWAAGRESVMDPGETTAAPITALSGYLASIYWSVATMTSTGYGDISANTGLGRILSLSAMVVGLLLYGYVLSSMAATLANLDRPRVQFQEKLFAVKSFMKERKLAKNLQDRVIQYLALLWQKHKGIWMPGQLPMLWDMPVGLQEDIGMADGAILLANVPLFKETDDSFLRTLGLMSTQYIFSPGDIVVYSGEIGREMFVIRRGLCEVVTPDMTKVLYEIGPGQHFGEMGMLFGNHRSVNVRAKTYCEILELKMSDVTNALKKFPLLEADFHWNLQDRMLFQEMQQIAQAGAADWPKGSNGESLHHLNFRIIPHKNDQEDEIPKPPLTIRRHSLDGRRSSLLNEDSIAQFVGKNSEYTDYISQQPRVVRILSKLLMKRTFLPQGQFLKAWTSLMVVTAMLLALTIPVQAAFLHTSIPLWVFHYIIDLLLFVRLYIRLHVGYFNDNRVLVTHPLCAAKKYLKTNFVVDLLTCFPFELIGFFCYSNFSSQSLHLFAMLRLNRLLSMYQVPKAFSYLESSVDKETGRVREIKFIFYCAIFVNWATCVVFMTACPPDILGTMGNDIFATTGGHNCISASWITNSHYNISTANMGTLYVISLYWSTATALSVGYGDIGANTDFEMIVSLIIMIFGVLFFGYIIASIAASRANDDAQRARFQEKLTAIHRYMEDQNLSHSLQRRVIDHYYHVWIRTKGIDPEGLFHGIPGAVWGDVAFSLYQEIISKISIFEGTEVSFHKLLSKCIKPMFFLKGEYIVRKYDIGHEMYFIHRGAVDVISEHDGEVFATLRAGTGFGEVALLFSCPRTATIKAKVNTDVFVLTKQDLDLALENYPDVRDQMMTIAKERRHQARVRSADRSRIHAQLSKHAEAMRKASEEEARESGLSSEDDEEIIRMLDHIQDDIPCDELSLSEDEKQCPEKVNLTKGDRDKEAGNGSFATATTQLSRSASGDKSIRSSGKSKGSFRRKMSVKIRTPSEENIPAGEKSKPACLADRIRQLNTFTVPPRRKAVVYFRLMMCILSVFSVWLITYQMAYQNHSVIIMVLTYSCDLFYFCDIYLKFHISFYNEHGDLVDEYPIVSENYRDRLTGFPVDCVAAFPLEIFALMAQPGEKLMMMSYLRLLHVIRFFNVYTYFNNLEKELDVNMLIVRLWKNIVNLGMTMHIFSCIWYMVACPLDRCRQGTWVEQADLEDKLDAYCTCIYWCIATMTSTGYGDVHAYTVIEMLFASAVMIVGKLMFGFVLGNIAFTLANSESLRVNYDQNLDSIKRSMGDQKVPRSLQSRIVEYFDYIWKREQGQDIKQLLKDCPECMLSDISLEVCRPMLDSLPLLRGTEESFLRQLSKKVNQVLNMPGDFIIRQGDIGNEVIFIKRGHVELLSSDKNDAEVIDQFGPGTLIGEINIVVSIPRKVSLRAKSYVDLLTLSKDNLDSVLEYFPLVAEHIKLVAEQRYGDVFEEIKNLDRETAVL